LKFEIRNQKFEVWEAYRWVAKICDVVKCARRKTRLLCQKRGLESLTGEGTSDERQLTQILRFIPPAARGRPKRVNMKRTAKAAWTGDLKTGKGVISTESVVNAAISMEAKYET
jgi:hypothetical protein